jgi:hypothetical protein
VLQVSIVVLIYLLHLTKDLAKKKDNHGEAVRQIPWHLRTHANNRPFICQVVGGWQPDKPKYAAAASQI